MKDSELSFPSETGELRACWCLDRPFAEVVTALGLKKRITPRAMRHYSTVSPIEMTESLAEGHRPRRDPNEKGRSEVDSLAEVAARQRETGQSQREQCAHACVTRVAQERSDRADGTNSRARR
jgi:hypothetical protein